MIDYKAFYKWATEKPGRMASITINDYGEPNGEKVFVYDHTLHEGQIVKSVDDINLEGRKEAADKAEFERLKAKYEQAS